MTYERLLLVFISCVLISELFSMGNILAAGNNRRIVVDRKSRELGRGSYGTVFRGTLNGDPVAVKRILWDLDVTVMASIEKEAELLLGVGDHPNILRYLRTEKDKIFM